MSALDDSLKQYGKNENLEIDATRMAEDLARYTSGREGPVNDNEKTDGHNAAQILRRLGGSASLKTLPFAEIASKTPHAVPHAVRAVMKEVSRKTKSQMLYVIPENPVQQAITALFAAPSADSLHDQGETLTD